MKKESQTEENENSHTHPGQMGMKLTQITGLGVVAQVVEYLPTKHKALKPHYCKKERNSFQLQRCCFPGTCGTVSELGRMRQEDQLSSGVKDQFGQHSKIL
jgi:hypothetical protein